MGFRCGVVRGIGGAEGMLPHVADLVRVWTGFSLQFPLGTVTTCTAPNGTLQMATNIIKLLRSHYCLRIAIPIMSIRTAPFAAVHRFFPQTARCIAMFR